MTQSPQYRIVVLLIAAACVAVVVVALFSGGVSSWQDVDDLSLSSLLRTPQPQNGRVSCAVRTYVCPRCRGRLDWGSAVCPQCGQVRAPRLSQAALFGPSVTPAAPLPAAGITAKATRQEPAAAPAVGAAPATTALLSPREQNAAGKEFIEGHWLGLEVIPLVPELAKEYQIPNGETGVLVDEITLEAAESGILAGDMVQSVDGRPTSDLRAFFLATLHVQEKERAEVVVSRRGEKLTFVIEGRNTRTLGFAQMEAAQPILPGAISPHRSRGRACTDCHIIMPTGGQLPTDAGDILPNPPPIARDAQAPHRYRGECSSCHVIIKQGTR